MNRCFYFSAGRLFVTAWFALWATSVAQAQTISPVAERQSMPVADVRDAALAGQLILVDIRTPQEWQQTGIPDVAVALDMTERGFAQKLLALREKNPDIPLGIICAVGGRSSYVVRELRKHGIKGLVDVPAGVNTRAGWLAKKLPVKAYKLERSGSETGR